MNLDLKDIGPKFKPVIDAARRYVVFGFVIVLLLIFGFFVFRINQFNNMEPADDAVEERLQAVQRPKIDSAVIEKIEDLESQNIQVQSLFENARNNPFNE